MAQTQVNLGVASMRTSFASKVASLAENGDEKNRGAFDLLLKYLSREQSEEQGARFEQRYSNVYYINDSNGRAHYQFLTPSDLRGLPKGDKPEDKPAICIVQDILPAQIQAVADVWEVNPLFFANHLINPAPEAAWEKGGWTASDDPGHGQMEHLIGNYEFHGTDEFEASQLNLGDVWRGREPNNYERPIFRMDGWPANYTVKLSYCMVQPKLCLFLVDRPLHKERESTVHASLRFPYAGNGGGILIPPLFPHDVADLHISLIVMFSHHWVFETMFLESAFPKAPFSYSIFPKVPLLYLLASSSWKTILHSLNDEIKKISFREIEEPKPRTTKDLHLLRMRLSRLLDATRETRDFMEEPVISYFRGLAPERPAVRRYLPVASLESTIEQGGGLNVFLLETFQLLMNTISISESRAGLQQASSALLLTRLASFYLPLSLTVGIFGMNLAELNQSGQPVWVFVVTGVIVSILTAAAIGSGDWIKYTWTFYKLELRKSLLRDEGDRLILLNMQKDLRERRGRQQGPSWRPNHPTVIYKREWQPRW